jgi:hypothetical protein
MPLHSIRLLAVTGTGVIAYTVPGAPPSRQALSSVFIEFEQRKEKGGAVVGLQPGSLIFSLA